ncbi:FixH family protein [Parahaliea sp. F7430]|uniref:FixH family protein n=1 Tax=Sediminihaliea albiluteola TaxID=2758564 RepID=A0A7W2YJF2_9GAMM|nr:FixH family protein [Sediminihaliea albiluteola]MBA6412564.1 FixH family protein [Sediminihaliea albiluteola]
MSNKATYREASSPWYKHSYAWLLFGLPACAVVASLWTVFIAYTGSDDLVVDEYYKDGLAINRQLDKKHNASSANMQADIQIRGDEVLLKLTGDLHPPRLRLLLSHPIEANKDFSVTLQRSSASEYRARMPSTPAPRWHWVLEEALDSGSSWRLDGAFTASDFSHANSL